MYKVVGIVERPEGVPPDDLRRWRLEEHTPEVKPDGGSAEIVILLTEEHVMVDGWPHDRGRVGSKFLTSRVRRR